MNAVEIKRELAYLRQQRAVPEEKRVRLRAERDRLLNVEPRLFRQPDVDAVDKILTQLDRDISIIDERCARLEAQLPSPELVLEAAMCAEVYAKGAMEYEGRFREQWPSFIRAVECVDTAARAVVSTCAEHRAFCTKIQALKDRFGIDAGLPAQPRADGGEMKYASLVGLLLRDVGTSLAVDSTTLRDLRAAPRPHAEKP